jgi:hypothetical protein
MKNQINVKTIVFLLLLSFLSGLLMMRSLQSTLSGSTMRLGIDLYPRWIGSEAALEGNSPYSFATRQKIWQEIYGSSELPEGNPFGFYYPPAIITLFSPFILMGFSIEMGAVFWCALSWSLWFSLLSLWTMQFFSRALSFKLIAVLLLFMGLIFRPAFSNYILGQNSLFCMVMLIAAWICYQRKLNILVGIFTSLSLIKPSLTIIPILLFTIFYYRDIKGYLSFAASSILLYLPPTLILGWWVPDFLNDITQYATENGVSWFAGDILSLSGMIWLLLSLGLIFTGYKHQDKILLLSASLSLNAIFIPHTADYDLVVFIPLLVLIGNRWLNTKSKFPLSKIAFSVLVFFPWLSLIYILRSGLSLPIEYWYRFIWLVYPILILSSACLTYLPGLIKIQSPKFAT